MMVASWSQVIQLAMTAKIDVSDVDQYPLRGIGNNSKTHETIRDKAFEYVFVPLKSAYVPALILLFFASFPTALFVALLFIGEPGLPLFVYAIPLLFSVVLLGLTYMMWKNIGGLKTISITEGLYWQGKTRPNIKEVDKSWVLLDEVQSIQIIEKPIYRKQHQTSSFEFNLVLESGQRINVVDHADGEGIMSDANEIAEHLRIPVNKHCI